MKRPERETKRPAKLLPFVIEDLRIMRSEFIIELVQAIVSETGIKQEDLDRIYSDLVHKWDERTGA